MVWTGDTDIYQIKKLFDNVGLINTNCVVEIEGRHYCFGRDDIYVNDGVAFKSIIEGQNKKYVFENLNRSKKQWTHVRYNAALREIMFCYPSADGEAAFPDSDYCNRAAVYNLDNGTWTFRDLPNVGVGTYAALSQSEIYATITTTYETAGGSYASYENSADKVLFFPSVSSAGLALTASRLYGYDLASSGRLAQAINSEATKKAWAQRIGIDLDEMNLPVGSYKVFKQMFPQAKSYGETGNFKFKFAGVLYPDPDITISWSDLQSFDPATQRLVDIPKDSSGRNHGGRYLAWHFENSSNFGHELSGADWEIVSIGGR
jgi:hypothetical protein